MRLACEKRLSDGSYLSRIYPSERDWRHKTNGIVVRAIDAEAIGDDIAQQEKVRASAALQLELPEIVGSTVSILYIEMDGTQIPMVRSELQGRAGPIEGKPARRREVKIGAVFTQTTTDGEGRPVRDENSTYIAAIENAEEFAAHIYTEAWERGWSRAEKKVRIADGADWIWNIEADYFERNAARMRYRNSVVSICSSAPGSLRPDAKPSSAPASNGL